MPRQEELSRETIERFKALFAKNEAELMMLDTPREVETFGMVLAKFGALSIKGSEVSDPEAGTEKALAYLRSLMAEIENGE